MGKNVGGYGILAVAIANSCNDMFFIADGYGKNAVASYV